MISPTIPSNESKRLEAIREYAILDTLPEKEFNDVAQLAAEICDIPMSFINLIDEKRQWTKATNIDVEIGSIDRKISFCAHCINEHECLIIEDSREDERFHDNPFVSTDEGHVIFYAGIPLINSDGFALGTICLADNKPRKISRTKIQTLQILANQIIQLFELRKSKVQLRNAYSKIASLHNKEQEQFAYSISHDLQVPLQNIINFSNLLQRRYQNSLEPTANQYLDFILSSSGRMKNLIGSLLDYARIGQKKKFVLVDTNQLVKEVLIDLNGVIEKTQATIKVANLPSIHVLKDAFRLLLQNLLSNAIKFSQQDVPPIINVTASLEKQHWIFSIKDNGIGIDEQFVEKIFFLFQRLHPQNVYEGSGIGLAHCKKIVSLHHGDIWATSIPNNGSTFYFTIPINIYEK